MCRCKMQDTEDWVDAAGQRNPKLQPEDPLQLKDPRIDFKIA